MVKLLLMIVMAAFLTNALGAPTSASTRLQRNKRAAKHDLAKKKGLISGWVTNWGANTSMPIYEKYDTLSWLGALTTPDGGVNLTVGNPPSAAFTETNMTTIRPLMTVGGWAGSQFFSSSITKKDKMVDFAANITATVMHWGFGGVDLDWEFPNSKPDNASHITADRGNWCNTNSPEDFDNFISLIKELRKQLTTAMKPLETTPLLVASVPFAGYFGKDGKRLGKEAKVLVAEGVLDWIIIMGYEMSSGYRHYTGPQAPLYINSKHPWDLDWSIHKSVKYWAEEVGIPRDKIQLGLPAFGKIFQTRLKGEKKKELKPNKDFENSFIYQPQKYPKVQMTPPEGWDDSAPWGTGLKATWERDFCSTYRQNQHGRAAAYVELMAMGYLDSKGDVTEMEGRQSSFDQVTQSPWIYNSTTGELVVYDDMRSLFVKSRYAKEQGLKGVKIFSVQHDTTDGALLRAVRGAWTSGKKSYEEWRKEVDGA